MTEPELKWPSNGEVKLWDIKPIWLGETVTILACGPSLTQEQVDMVRGRMRVIAVNDAYEIALWADILYACDANTWAACDGAPDFGGIKVSLRWDAVDGVYHGGWTADIFPDVRSLADTGIHGLEILPNGLRTGKNSGYQAINMAVHLGVKRILLLGYDMRSHGNKHHWNNKRQAPPYSMFLDHFGSIVEPLKEAGVEVINCTPDSALKVFPQGKLEEEI